MTKKKTKKKPKARPAITTTPSKPFDLYTFVGTPRGMVFHRSGQRLLQSAVRVAVLRQDCAGVLVLFDAADDCPKDLAPTLEQWAREAAGGVACAVVMANREYEAWFLASIEALRGKAAILSDATSHPNPEVPRGAKGELERRMRHGASYHPTVDQEALTAHLNLENAYRRCRSFRKLVSAFGALATAAGVAPAVWPPAAWVS